jgi:tetratricopeptide (TPR) repeat protein
MTRKDFFISRSGEDARWAQWIAWQLEAAGYSTIVQDWDFRPGSNFVSGMRRALDAADTTIAVYSPAYFLSPFTEDEWTAAIATRGDEEVRFLPVRVAEVAVPRLLQPIVYVDLVGLDEQAARTRLLDAVKRRPRGKPMQEPTFPGDFVPQFPPRTDPSGEGRPVRIVNAAPARPSRFLDRTEQTHDLGAFLHDPEVRLVSILGRVGIGKSALAGHALAAEAAARPEDGDGADGGARRPDAVIFFDSRTTGMSLEDVYADLRRLVDDQAAGRLAEYWSRTDTTLRENVDALLDTLHGLRIIVALDGLDRFVEDGAISGEGLRSFVEACLERHDAPCLVATSRVDLTVPPEAFPVIRSVRLRDGLPVPDAVALLRSLDPQDELGLADAPESELARAAEVAAGVPRALQLLAGMLQDDPASSLPALLSDERALGSRVVEGLVAEAYARLGDDEQRVLEAMAVFDAPVTETAIRFVVHTWYPEIDVRASLRRLVASHFTTATRSSGEYLLQSADQVHAYERIPAAGAAGSGEGPPGGYHRAPVESRVADYYASVRLPPSAWQSIESVGPQIAEFEHRVRAGEVDHALEVLDLIDRNHLFLWGNYTRLLELRQQVVDLPARPDLRAANLASLAVVNQVLGQYDEATEYYEQAVESARVAGDDALVAEYLGHLGRLYRNLGYMDEALASSRNALESAERAGDREAVGRWQDRLGLVYAALGRLDEALALHREAVAIAREFDDRRSQGAAMSNLGVVLHLLGRTEEAEQAQRDALVLSRAVDDRRGDAIILGRQGVLAASLDQFDRALKLHEKSLAIALALGERRERSYQLLGRGRAHFGLGAFAEAEDDLRAALALEMPETAYAAALALGVLHTVRASAEVAASFASAVRRCRERLDRSDGLFAARYALAIAIAGAAASSDAWTDPTGRAERLAPALSELERAIQTCDGAGAMQAALRDIRTLAAHAQGLEPMVLRLEEALDR